jgi:hypothetical protein
LAESNEQ